VYFLQVLLTIKPKSKLGAFFLLFAVSLEAFNELQGIPHKRRHRGRGDEANALLTIPLYQQLSRRRGLYYITYRTALQIRFSGK